jgi:2-oxoacid:acceptor oxidoreductase gamma subunit (pyruvate/2-ketoisovalerate family)
MKEMRFHGRGGQGVVVAVQILATALTRDGKYAASFPTFGFERRGAPVAAFCRLDDKPIRERTLIYHPDCVVVLDPFFVRSEQISEGLKEGAILVANTAKPIEQRRHKNLSAICSVDATKVGLQEIGLPITNTCMLGALAAGTGWVQLDSLCSSLEEFYSGQVLERNRRCVERGFKEIVITQW